MSRMAKRSESGRSNTTGNTIRKKFNPWKIKRNGKTLEPLMKALPGTFSLAYKKTDLFFKPD